jgi:bacterioferritin-associated ferredoxin
MYVCICHNITEEDLKRAVRETHSPGEVVKKLGLGSSCGSCIVHALEKVQGEMNGHGAPRSAESVAKNPAKI